MAWATRENTTYSVGRSGSNNLSKVEHSEQHEQVEEMGGKCLFKFAFLRWTSARGRLRNIDALAGQQKARCGSGRGDKRFFKSAHRLAIHWEGFTLAVSERVSE